jgi:prophage regulatory protein
MEKTEPNLADVDSDFSSLPALLTADEVANVLGVASRTLWRFKSKRAIPMPVKFGGNVRWRAKDLQKWLDEGCPANN